jgi:hypothetical protein
LHGIAVVHLSDVFDKDGSAVDGLHRDRKEGGVSLRMVGPKLRKSTVRQLHSATALKWNC